MNTKICLKEKAAKLDELWSPRILGELDESYVKIAKGKGTLPWHKHEEDEFFLVIEGNFKIEMEDQSVELSPGEMFIVPKGVMHKPECEEECSVLVIEKKSTKHTGDVEDEVTRSLEDQLRPL